MPWTLQYDSYLVKEGVSCCMPICFVDKLQTIDIQEHKSQGIMLGNIKFLQFCVEGLAVQEAGKTIMGAEV